MKMVIRIMIAMVVVKMMMMMTMVTVGYWTKIVMTPRRR
jgi:hypothetical protein